MSIAKNGPTEAKEQSLFFTRARMWLPEKARGLLWGSMNAGRRSGKGIGFAKATGLVKGVPDIQLAWPRLGYHGLFIEMKRAKPKGKLSPEQEDMLAALEDAGYCAKVAYGCDEAMKILTKYMLGKEQF